MREDGIYGRPSILAHFVHRVCSFDRTREEPSEIFVSASLSISFPVLKPSILLPSFNTKILRRPYEVTVAPMPQFSLLGSAVRMEFSIVDCRGGPTDDS